MKKNIKGNIEFKEEQRFRQLWMWLLMLSPTLIMIGLVIGLSSGDDESKQEMQIALAIFVPLNIIILYLVFITRLETIVTSEAVYFRWAPFQKRFMQIQKDVIESAVARKGPVLHSGFKIVPGYGRVHSVVPGKGIQFVLKTGRKIFIGSQKISGFQRAVEKLIPVSTK